MGKIGDVPDGDYKEHFKIFLPVQEEKKQAIFSNPVNLFYFLLSGRRELCSAYQLFKKSSSVLSPKIADSVYY
jgi:hypothetical protein